MYYIVCTKYISEYMKYFEKICKLEVEFEFLNYVKKCNQVPDIGTFSKNADKQEKINII